MQEPTEPIATGRPWSPFAIAILTVLFSPIVGGILHGLNTARLGQGRLRRFILARNLLASLLFILLSIVLRESRFQLTGASLFFAAYFYRSQESLFQDFLAQGGRKGSLVTAILIALLVVLGAMLFVVGLSVLVSP
jgi:hypothetical protein